MVSTRQPIWSDRLTLPLASSIPRQRRPAALRAIRAIHTAAFFAIAACIAVFDWDGLRGRPGRRAWLAAGVAIGESLTYVSNNQVCPLTPLAEELGARSGTVTDLYLPKGVSDRVPLIGGSALVVGVALHALTLRRQSAQAGTTTTSHVARLETSDETLPRMSRRRFVRGRDPRMITSACSASAASRIVSAGSPSQIR